MKLHIYTLHLRSFLIPVLYAFLGMGFLHGAILEPGVAFPELTDMQDQHGVAYPLPDEVKYIAVAFTMGVGKSANKYFAEKGSDFLPENNSVFIANIYGMPAIGRFFAMPKMQKYPHRIMLADAKDLLDEFPQRDDCVTVFDIDSAGKIKAIRYWDPKLGELPF